MGSDLLQSCDYHEVTGESHDCAEEQTYMKEKRSCLGLTGDFELDASVAAALHQTGREQEAALMSQDEPFI